MAKGPGFRRDDGGGLFAEVDTVDRVQGLEFERRFAPLAAIGHGIIHGIVPSVVSLPHGDAVDARMGAADPVIPGRDRRILRRRTGGVDESEGAVLARFGFGPGFSVDFVPGIF